MANMSSSGPPPQPYSNPTATANTQQQYNLNAAEATQAANNVNQYTPFGSLEYTQRGTGPNGIPLYSATTNLSPQMQAIVNSLQGGISNQLDQSGYATGNAADTVGNATEGNTKWLLDKQVSYMQPFFTQQQEQLDNQLRNQGIGPENPAYTRAMNNLSQSQNQSITGFLAQAEPQAFNQAMQSYMLPLGVSTGLYNMINPSFGTSSFVNTPQTSVAAPNYASAVSDYNNAQMQAYNAKVQENTAMMTGLMGIPTAVLGGWARGGFAGI